MKQNNSITSKKNTLLVFTVLVLAIPALLFLLVSWYQNNKMALPYFGEKYTIGNKPPYYTVPDFSFTNQEGKITSRDHFKGKVWVAGYFFTSCPSICPKMVSNLTKVQAACENNIDIILFSVDPERDSVQRLNSYAELHNIHADNWQLVTGKKETLYSLARNGFFIVATDGDGGENDFIHSDNVLLIDKDFHIRGYYNATSSSGINNLITDIKRLN
jgi:protein SCO1/2